MKNNEKSNKNKWMILSIVLIPILIAVGVVAGGFIFSGNSVNALSFKTEETKEVSIPLEEFLVNLGTEGSSRSQFVKLELSLLSNHEEAQEIIETNIAQVRDSVIYVVHKKTGDDLFAEVDGSFAMKEELRSRINESLGQEIVDEVFITNILMQ